MNLAIDHPEPSVLISMNLKEVRELKRCVQIVMFGNYDGDHLGFADPADFANDLFETLHNQGVRL